MNFDVVVFSDQHCSSFGAIIRNSAGEVMAGMSVTGPDVNNSEEAEVLACRRSVEFSREVGFSRVIIEGDCLNVMRALSVSIRIAHCLATSMKTSSSILEECRSCPLIGLREVETWLLIH